MNLNDDITTIKGIGEKMALLFSKASVFCVNDLLHYFPRNYEIVPSICSISEVISNTNIIIRGKVKNTPTIFSNKGKSILNFQVYDDSGIINVCYFGMPYLKKEFYPGRELILWGICNEKRGLILSQPKLLSEDEYKSISGKIMPLYPLTKGLSNNQVTKSIKNIIEISDKFNDFIPDEIKEKYNLMPINLAFKQMHFPASMKEVYDARRRLCFDEFFFFLLKIKLLKEDNVKLKNDFNIKWNTNIDNFINNLPFALTKAQSNAVSEIRKDLCSNFSMNRLLQGDVGSGKTIVSFIAALMVVNSGYQVSLIAPTEVLAMQHYNDILRLNSEYNLGFKPCVLTGSVTAKNKREIKKGILSGEYNIVIGTHAVIQDDVSFMSLALCICDEQHRFGVRQRLNIQNKGNNVHVLVMSATPIPRTLGLILYGDLDISIIDELPKNRLPIKNSVLGSDLRAKIYRFMNKMINEGRQCYVICPMVEEGENEITDGLCDVSSYTKELRTVFPASVNISMLHGKMKNSEKNEIMNDFKNGNIDILVSTTVVEVGVNVPNASVIVIENAERFGLAQLHQLRGRVGRGKYQSYCIFVSSSKSQKSIDRLNIIGTCNDGFKIASEDLKQRGPGDFFGYKQSGIPMFKVADIYTDSQILKEAKEAIEIIENKSYESLVSILNNHKMFMEEATYVDFHGICL